ncbi:hypothetical protein GCM10010238_30600 [Streptomyces griseoviridis]|uniref:Uncharacterized protein n=1 Tax=Streptomyces griseoviridis TaxID=45398 RepID=A0A918LEW0_STRGD|nr:hypothetical protein GCM10010238_30600 [Streptomyces niveoruber]
MSGAAGLLPRPTAAVTRRAEWPTPPYRGCDAPGGAGRPCPTAGNRAAKGDGGPCPSEAESLGEGGRGGTPFASARATPPPQPRPRSLHDVGPRHAPASATAPVTR